MRDRATYESNLSNNLTFRDTMVDVYNNLNSVCHKCDTKDRKRIQQKSMKQYSEFMNHAKFSILKLSNIMYGFTTKFTLYNSTKNGNDCKYNFSPLYIHFLICV